MIASKLSNASEPLQKLRILEILVPRPFSVRFPAVKAAARLRARHGDQLVLCTTEILSDRQVVCCNIDTRGATQPNSSVE